MVIVQLAPGGRVALQVDDKLVPLGRLLAPDTTSDCALVVLPVLVTVIVRGLPESAAFNAVSFTDKARVETLALSVTVPGAGLPVDGAVSSPPPQAVSTGLSTVHTARATPVVFTDEGIKWFIFIPLGMWTMRKSVSADEDRRCTRNRAGR
jgi:hypothetical protein